MKINKQFAKNTLIYLLLLVGFVFIYVVDIDLIIHPNKEVTVKSKIDFVYQQF